LTVCAQPSLRKSLALETARYDFFPPILPFVLGGLIAVTDDRALSSFPDFLNSGSVGTTDLYGVPKRRNNYALRWLTACTVAEERDITGGDHIGGAPSLILAANSGFRFSIAPSALAGIPGGPDNRHRGVPRT
jgi:hypothetical protein